MGWLDKLRGQTVGLDTAPLIYYIEDLPVFAERLQDFFQAVASGEIQLVTSTVTLIEVLVHPLKLGNDKLAHQYNDILLSSPHVMLKPVSAPTAQLAGDAGAENSRRDSTRHGH